MSSNPSSELAGKIVLALKPKLDKISNPVSEESSNEEFLVTFITIAHQIAGHDASERKAKILKKRSLGETEQSGWEESLSELLAQVFGEGMLIAMAEVARIDWPVAKRTTVLQSVAMDVYWHIWRSLEMELLKKPLSEINPEEYTSKIRLGAKALTQEAVLYVKQQAQAASEKPKSSKTSKKDQCQTQSGSTPQVKRDSCWQDLGMQLKQISDIYTEITSGTEQSGLTVWVLMAFLGPIVYYYWAYQFLPPRYAQYLLLLPLISFSLYLLEPFVKQGYLVITRPQLVLIAALSTLTVYFYGTSGVALITLCLILILYLGIVLLKNLEYKYPHKQMDAAKATRAEKVNPDLMYAKLGADPIALHVGMGLLPMADPKQDDQLLSRVSALRESLTSDLGYILPAIRMMDDANIGPNEYLLSVRRRLVNRGTLYPGYYMLEVNRLKELGLESPRSAIVSQHPDMKNGNEVVWLKATDIPELLQKEAQAAADVLIHVIRLSTVRACERIMTLLDILKRIHLLNDCMGTELVAALVPGRLSYDDLKRILANLIRENVNIIDIAMVFELLFDYSRFEKRADFLSEKLRLAFNHEICKDIAGKTKEILVLELSSAWEKLLSQHLQETDYGQELVLEGSTQCQLSIQIGSMLDKAKAQHGKMPVILCSSALRLPLFRALADDLPELQVLASNELAYGFTKIGLGVIQPIL